MSAASSHRAVRTIGALVAVLALVVAACGSSTPALTDPKEILTKAFEATQDAKSFHLVATVDGEFDMDLLGTGGGSMTLAGTKLEGDIDVVGKKLSLTFAFPALLGLIGEVIAVDEAAYVKTSFSGDKYQKMDAGDTGLPIDPSDPDASLAGFKEMLDEEGVDPTKLDDADCGSTKCYVVEIELTAEELAALAGPDASNLPFEDGTLTLTVMVDKSSLHFADVKIEVAAGTAATLTISIAFSDWDRSVTIEAPPADQVEEGGSLFPF